MASIIGGKRLRSVQTVDKSGPGTSGKVLGDNAPPAHINTAARPPSPPSVSASGFDDDYVLPPTQQPIVAPTMSSASNRQSVDWYAGLAADASPPVVDRMPSMREEYEEPYSPPPPPPAAAPAPIPDIHVDDEPVSDLMADIDKSTGEFAERFVDEGVC